MINNRFNVVYHLLYECKLNFIQLKNKEIMEYTIKIQELIKRPLIRTDFEEEWMNKMTDEELSQFDKESYDMCIKDGTPEKYPDINAACLSKHIDRGILYNLFKQQ